MDKSKNYAVIISERAKQMLGSHLGFMAQANPNAARKTKERFIKELRTLTTMPQRFPFFEESYMPPNKYHKMFVEKWYLVLYQIKDDTVFVDYILDCRQDYDWLIK